MSDSDLEEPLLVSSNDSLTFWHAWHYSGVACAFGTAINFSVISVLVKLMQGQLNRVNVTGKRGNRLLLIGRGICGTFSIVFYYVSLFLLPISDAVVIGCTHPLLTALAAKVFLHEEVSFLVIVGALTSFAGVAIISYTPSSTGSEVWDENRVNGVVMALLSALCATGGSLCIRVIGHREQALTITTYLQGIATIVCLSLMFLLQALGILRPSSLEVLQPIVWVYLGIIGILAWSGQLMLTRALQLLPAAIALGIGLSSVAVSFLFGIFLFQDSISIQGCVGTMVVLAGVLTLCV